MTGEWTDVSPVKLSAGDDLYFGYSGLTVDRQKPGTLIVATQISWWPDAIFFRSTDSGATWTRIWDWNGYPSQTKRYTMDISANPWLDFNTNPQPPEATPKLGWMNESVEIDPFDSNRMLYGTGATVYATTQLTNWDSNTTFTIRPMAKGLEETAVLDLASPPSGAPLVSALGDIGGFHHADLDAVPATFHDQPSLGSNTSLDFAELNPQVFVRVGNADAAPHIGVSSDGGKNWYAGQEPAGVTGGGSVAVSADANAVVWAPAGAQVHYSTTRGSSWTLSTGLPAEREGGERPGQPQDLLRVRGGQVLPQHRRRGHLHRLGRRDALDRPGQLPRRARQGRRRLAGRARPGCCTPPTRAPPSRRWPE
nr:hypothetical protein GCM10020092_058980 [Actinoplanes digitatis]